MARQSGEMALLGRLLADEASASPEEMRLIAKHFETEQDAFLAGKFYHMAGDETRAVHLLLKAAAVGHKEALEVAVQAAAASEDTQLSDQVIQFICGDVDGVPKVI
jgi:WD repeat-containing protein 19